MKTRNVVLVVVSWALLALAANVCAAESTLIRVKVPFDFLVDGQSFPAGDYTLTYPQLPGRDQMLLSNAEGRGLRIIQTHGFEQRTWDTRTYVVFHGYGDQYFLSRVWSGGMGMGRELARSARERELVNKVAQNGSGKTAAKVIYLSAAR
jgi:hypothetical protein